MLPELFLTYHFFLKWYAVASVIHCAWFLSNWIIKQHAAIYLIHFDIFSVTLLFCVGAVHVSELRDKASSGITQYTQNLLYFIPIKMGTAVRITGSAVWSQQSWVCSLRSASSADAPLPGPRCQHFKKYVLGKPKSASFNNKAFTPVHTCPCSSFCSNQNSDWILAGDTYGKLVIQSFAFQPFLQLSVFCLYIRCALRGHLQQTSHS